MFEAVLYVVLLAVIAAIGFKAMADEKRHKQKIAALAAGVPKLAERLADEKYARFRSLLNGASGCGISSLAVQNSVVAIRSASQVEISACRGSQVLWLRWHFDTNEHEILDLWQFPKGQDVLILTSAEAVPEWAQHSFRKALAEFGIWKGCCGDRIAYVNSLRMGGGEIKDIVNIFELEADALISFALPPSQSPQAMFAVDDGPDARRQASEAFIAVNRKGPPRKFSVDSGSWTLPL
jgi:hypothetical protein